MISRRTIISSILVASVGVVSCTSSNDDPEAVGRSTIADTTADTTDESAPPDTGTDPSADDSTPIEKPDATDLPTISEPDPDVRIGQLPNGLRYLIRSNDNPGGRASMRLAIDAGSVLETDEQSGVAHFVEHMMFNGTEQFPENELVATLRGFGAEFGADVNAYTSFDETVYELSMPAQDAAVVDTGIDVLEQWLSAATIDEVQVEAERGVVLDEWRGSATTSDGRIFDEVERLMLTGTDYEGRDPIGTDGAINAVTAAPLRSFYDDWYRPDNAGLVIVGDIDVDAIEQQVIEQFGPLTARGASPERVEPVVTPPAEPAAVVLADPDVADPFAYVTLPSALDKSGTVEEFGQRSILDALAFDIIATRLRNEALRGDAPFDDAYVSSSTIVRGLDAPEIGIDADSADIEASTQAVFDEYERVRRFGFSGAEVARAVESVRSAADTEFSGRESRQDVAFADQYVSHLLEDAPIPTADAQFEFVSEVLDRATPETVAYGFVNRLAATSPQVLAVVPEADADVVAAESVFVDQATSMRDREIVPLADDTAIGDSLMEAPVDGPDPEQGSIGSFTVPDLVDPVVLEFPNGVTVSLNQTAIVDGEVAFEARSGGGLEAVADADVADADAAATVIAESGLGAFDSVQLEAFLSDKDVEMSTYIDQFNEGMVGRSSADDLTTLMQLIHLTMTAPKVDELAVTRYVEEQTAYAEDPSVDPGYAESVALLEARYEDARYRLPTVDSLATVDSEGIARVMTERFGDASDWDFAFSGSIDIGQMTDLARTYLGTLPATGRVESPTYVEPTPPTGIVAVEVAAGTSEQANVSWLFTAPASNERRDDVAALLVQEVVTARLTDVIREALGESYSPYSSVAVSDGPSPLAETYISTSTSPELVGAVNDAVNGELDDLRRNGPTDVEFQAAIETIRQQLDLFYNEQINDEILDALVASAPDDVFDAFLDEPSLIDGFDRNDIRDYIDDWIAADEYISVTVTPR